MLRGRHSRRGRRRDRLSRRGRGGQGTARPGRELGRKAAALRCAPGPVLGRRLWLGPRQSAERPKPAFQGLVAPPQGHGRGRLARYGGRDHHHILRHRRRRTRRHDARLLAGARRRRCRGAGEARRFLSRLSRRHHPSLDAAGDVRARHPRRFSQAPAPRGAPSSPARSATSASSLPIFPICRPIAASSR